ncbi:MAG: FAD-binding oxidoreductase [Firmicutes bacterium]|nr:FAD-binding oxidoreductase [Bacillota bacterium]
MSKAFDVIVVGGGVIGSSVTYYLSKEGFQVALFDRGDLASGTSSACDGNVLATDKMPGFDSQMTYKSQQLLAGLQDELAYDFEYRQPGSTLAVEDEGQAIVARDWTRRQREAGLPMRYIEGGEVHEDEPMIAPDIIGLVECKSDSSLYPMGLVYGFTLAAQRLGAEVHQFSEVRSILKDSTGAVKGVEASDGTYHAPRVVISAGVWTPAVAATAGVNVPIKPRKGHILVTESTFRIGRRKVMEFGYLMAKFGGKEKRRVEPDMEKYGVALVFEPTMQGNYLIGSSREFVGFDTTCNESVLALLARRAVRFYPAMEDLHIVRSYAGLRPYTPDHLPIISPANGVSGLYVAAGHEGDGIGLAPITGKIVAEMLADRDTSMDLNPLRLDRFDQVDRGPHQGL